jgi:Ca-activated chloride channel family protein
MENWIFKDPFWLFLFLAFPLIAWLRNRRSTPVMVVPFAAAWTKSSHVGSKRWPIFLAYLGALLLVFALARPQKVKTRHESQQKGYDIILAIDLSGSMLAEDYEKGGQRINRLQAVKPVLEAFINQRENDRIGLVVFAGRAYTLSPLTFDHDWLRRQAGRLSIGLLEDGTALGDGAGVALTRLRQGSPDAAIDRQGAFIVLLTDGSNNTGNLKPEEVTDLAVAEKIPIYTIGAGKEGIVPMPIVDREGNRLGGYRRMLSDLDEVTLRSMARKTGGKYFKADDSDTISSAFAAIDETEKIEFQAKSYLLTEEFFSYLAIPGLGFLTLSSLSGFGSKRRNKEK